ncbi:MAG: hypothetical protein IPI58_05675 [Alphaproteobacteria bacterium]|nr:MAG: hypothetical protein IPI58_05675 [Alphaproteobacteria bacterium]
MSEQIETEVKLKIHVDPSFLCVGDDVVRLNRKIAYQALVNLNQVTKGSDLERAIDRAIKHVEVYDASPIIVTSVPGENVRPLLMSYNTGRRGEGNDAYAITTSSLRDYMKWSALRESFTRSGVPVHTHMLPSSVGSRGVWPRDFYFKIGNHAFFPDPDVMADHYFMNDELRQKIKEAHQDIVKVVTAAGITPVILNEIDFEGGDIITDPVENYLFWGYRYYPSEEDRQDMKDAIYQHTGMEYKVVPIERDGRRYGHLDIGMSPMLPNNHFFVSCTLGRDGGGLYEGYESLKRCIGSTDRLNLRFRKDQSNRVITVSGHDSFEHLMTNLISIGPVVFMSHCDKGCRDRLSADGIVVNAPSYTGPLTPGFKCRNIGDGGVRCLTNEL